MTDIKLPQVWHPLQQWEEVAHNMWGKVKDRSGYLQQAIDFTGDHERYGHFMRRVCAEWPISTENAFTDPHLNHKAWLGHAACALAFRCPEDIVRQAWSFLGNEQKLLANKEARRAIAAWRRAYITDKKIRQDVAHPMLW
jgi:hypothetical protein